MKFVVASKTVECDYSDDTLHVSYYIKRHIVVPLAILAKLGRARGGGLIYIRL